MRIEPTSNLHPKADSTSPFAKTGLRGTTIGNTTPPIVQKDAVNRNPFTVLC
jgi:hypothetical protein